MMRSHERLVHAKRNMSIGNHKVMIYGVHRDFIYFKTAICQVDDEKKTFHCTDGGWDTQSTKRAISSYRNYFLSKGYTEI